MTLAEIQTMRTAARAKVEDLIARTASREPSTEETQMLADLQAEGTRLNSLAARYGILEEFDRGAQPSPIVRTLAAQTKKNAWADLDLRLRTDKSATDVPLQIQQSPVNTGAAASVVTEYDPKVREVINFADIPGQLGITDYNRTDTNPLKITLMSAAVAASTYNEGSAPTESQVPTWKQIDLAGARYQALTKVSYESLNNVFFDVAGAVVRSIGIGIMKAQSSAFMAALKAAVQAKASACYVSNSGTDRRQTLTDLIGSLHPSFQGRFAFNQTDYKSLMNQRDLENRPLIDMGAGTILGRPFVVFPDSLGVDRCFYGDFSQGSFRSLSPLYLSRLSELYAQSAQVGFSGYQFCDFAFLAELDLDQQPILFSNLEGAGS